MKEIFVCFMRKRYESVENALFASNTQKSLSQAKYLILWIPRNTWVKFCIRLTKSLVTPSCNCCECHKCNRKSHSFSCFQYYLRTVLIIGPGGHSFYSMFGERPLVSERTQTADAAIVFNILSVSMVENKYLYMRR